MHLHEWGWAKVMFFSMYDLPALKGMSISERRRIVRAALTKYDKEWFRQYDLRFVVAPFVTLVASFLVLFFLAGDRTDAWKAGIIISSVCLSFLATYLADRWLRNDARLPEAVQTYLDLDYEASA